MLENRKFWIKSGGLVALLAAYATFGGTPAVAASYSFAAVQDTNNPDYSEFLGTPSINDAGVVAYLAVRNGQLWVEANSDAIHFLADYDNQSITSPVLNNSATPRATFQWTLNNRANVVLLANPFEHFITANGEFHDFGPPAINDASTLAFYANRDDGTSGIYTNASLIANSEGLFSAFGKVVSINNAREVAFAASAGRAHV